MVELDLEVHFGSFDKDALPRLQSRLLNLKLDPLKVALLIIISGESNDIFNICK